MRAVILSVLVLLAFTPSAGADAGLPINRRVANTAVVEFGSSTSGYRLFEVGGSARSLKMIGPRTALLESGGGSRRAGVRLCAVPEALIGPDEIPKTNWLRDRPGVLWSPHVPVGDSPEFFCDPRDGTVRHYRADLTSTEVRLELMETRTEWSWPTVIVMGFLSLALALGGIWVVRRFRRKQVTQTVPPPDN